MGTPANLEHPHPQAEAVPGRQEKAMQQGEKVNILMVDDQPAKLLSYEAILSGLGENLIKADSARSALEHLLKTDVAVVLMDVNMPDVDGFELAAMIREHPRYEQTAIIFVSAVRLTEEDLVRGYSLGAVDYVSVPVVPEVLRAKVGVFAELYRKTRQLERLNRELERRVEERTRELEARRLEGERTSALLETVLASAPAGIAVYDRELRFVRVNEALARLTGLPAEEHLGRTMGEALPALAPLVEPILHEVLRTGEPVLDVGVAGRPDRPGDGGYYLASYYPIRENGEVWGVGAVVQDISERKRAEEELRASEERFRLMADAVPQVIWMTDAQGRAEFFNREWTDYCGVPFEPTTTAQLVATFTHPDDAPRVLAAFEEARRTGGPFEVEQRNRSASGEYRWFLNRGRPYRDPRTGEVVKWFGVGVDIHDRKLAEAALQASERRYRELSEAQKRFVNDAAHELRAPLTAIVGNLQLLARFKNMRKADREEALAEVTREAVRLSRLVNDMLALARGDAGLRLRLEPLRLDEVLREAFATARVLGKDHRMERGPLPEAWVTGDADRLKQLALQLLENALKYTPAGGTVRLELDLGDAHAEFRVADTGVGIAPEDLPHVFERFYRADRARSRAVGGSGLGLAIARWIAEQHGGGIRLESELGKGTVAVVRLPLAPDAPRGR
ncbi:Alkaline phosphatase synthesis sensor protein PhoR [Calidithermus terrae]|uniref:histidine kinase n=1 Tax=Calidithermus terrae TaxID=1408545 RepID=A0A399EEI1_9DEIN|nr:PAS domain-containing protein [Calidithermus terrae]RIH81559.1 Alkaline phosphatase synthesis sensor protein PhoR [Calidithermus terrae]